MIYELVGSLWLLKQRTFILYFHCAHLFLSPPYCTFSPGVRTVSAVRLILMAHRFSGRICRSSNVRCSSLSTVAFQPIPLHPEVQCRQQRTYSSGYEVWKR